MLSQLISLIPTASPNIILTDFESVAMNAFRETFPNTRVSGCYFHLCQSINRKVNELGLKSVYESNQEIKTYIRCLPALANVPVNDVSEAFDIYAENMPEYEHMDELLAYFEKTYIRRRRRFGRIDKSSSTIFQIELWNKYDAATDGIARTTNIVEGWHCGLQSLFMCSHPSVWVFIEGLIKDSKKQKASYLQSISGVEHPTNKRYNKLKERVLLTTREYGRSNILLYLKAIVHISHS
ncbi:hypothetical protein RF11_12597 [Thelohanellus kitauei]|uniref:Uncharacterized protein n=1 Tax=Thelohanellus kitauei TaxID=669202 RepID=A0A0C2MM75_THEKT|nr:hypothetical protein RF11_12597 [Thelohanellus kitauei]